MKIWKNKSSEILSLLKDGKLYVEEWEPINGFEGLYEISSFGRVKSLDRIYKLKKGGNKKIKGKIIAIQQFPNKYLVARLWQNNIVFNFLVHRLVGERYIPNPQNLPEINHKFGDKEDNFFIELEWVSKSDNMKHSYDFLNHTKTTPMLGKFGKQHPNSKPIYCATLGISFESSRIAERQLGISQGTISDICRGKQLQRDGLVFNFI